MTINTRRVRIAVLITPSGDWDCRGWGYDEDVNEEDRVLLEKIRKGSLGEDLGWKIYWIEAGVPVPEYPIETDTIEGVVMEVVP